MSKFKFDRVIKNIEVLKRTLPPVIANDTKKFFLDSWRKQGWDDGTVKSWQTPKRKMPGTKEYMYPKKGAGARRSRAILVGKGSGRLRRAVGSSLKQATFNRIHFSVELPYAAIHNEGLPMKNGKPMPKRQFMGHSKSLEKLQLDKIKKAVDKVWQA